MLREALGFPTRGDSGVKALLIGGTLLLLGGVASVAASAGLSRLADVPFEPSPVPLPELASAGTVALAAGAIFLVFRLLVRGYYVSVLRRAAATPEAKAPSFGSPRRLFTDGLKAEVVALVYLLPATALLGVALGGDVVAAIEDPRTAIRTARTLASLVLLVGLLYVVGMFYVVPAAVTNFAYEGEFLAAFRVRTVLSGAVSEDYAVGWVLATVTQAMLLPVAFLLQGLLVGFFLRFLVDVAARYLYGRSFGAAMGFDPLTVGRPTVTPDASRNGRTEAESADQVEPPADAADDADSGDDDATGSPPDRSTGRR